MGFLRGLYDEFPFSAEAMSAFGTYGRQFFGPFASYLTGRVSLGSHAWPVRFKAEALWERGETPGAFIFLPRLEAGLGRRIELHAGARLVYAPHEALKFGLFRADDTVFVALAVGL